MRNLQRRICFKEGKMELTEPVEEDVSINISFVQIVKNKLQPHS